MPGSRRRRVVFTAPAERDLDDIFRYIANHDVSAAERQVMEIIEHRDALDMFSERGALRPHWRPTFGNW